MKKMQPYKKGFSLVEVIVTLAILVIVLGIVVPLFISNYKSLNETETRNDLQREGQQAMKYISDKAMETTTIQAIEATTVQSIEVTTLEAVSLDDSSSATLEEIEFNTPNIDSTTNKGINYYFTLKDSSLYYQQKPPDESIDHTKDKKIADNIKEIQIQAIDEKNFNECNGLNIKMTLSKNKVDYTLESEVRFRNAQVSSN